MKTIDKHNKNYALLQVACVAVLWAASLFETGVDFFCNIFGITSFMLAAAGLVGLLIIEFFVFDDLNIKFGQAEQIKKALLLVILIYIALSFLGIAWSPLPGAACQKSLRILWFFVLSMSSILVLQKFSSTFALRVLGGSGVFSLLALLLFVFSSGNRARNWSANSISVFADYNIFYLHLIISVLMSIALLNQLLKKKIWLVHLAVFGSYGLLTFMLLFSGSRRGIIFYCIPILVIAVISLLRARRFLIPLTAVIVLVTLALSVLLPTLNNSYKFTTVQRILISVRQEGLIGIIGGRMERIEWAADYINEFSVFQLIFGAGTKAYTALFGKGNHPHNFYLNAFIEGGLLKSTLVIILYLLFIVLGFISARRHLFYEQVLIFSVPIMFMLNISISGEDGLLLKLFWLLLVYFWFACNRDSEVLEVTE
ncbi:MAG TPA: hypothetical protein DG577_03270 [Firmicutes bacterium]|nr:hypothetical protein [Bacillota bacterium]